MCFKALVLYILAVIIQRDVASCVELGVIVVSVYTERNQPKRFSVHAYLRENTV